MLVKLAFCSFQVYNDLTPEQIDNPTQSLFLLITWYVCLGAVYTVTVIVLTYALLFICILLWILIFKPRMQPNNPTDLDLHSFRSQLGIIPRFKKIPFTNVLLDIEDSRECIICFDDF